MKKILLSLRPPGLFSLGFTHPMVFGPDIPFATKPVRKNGKIRYELYIPGSSVKGALRSAASRVANSFGFTSCEESLSILLKECDVCALFGKPGTVYPKIFFGEFVSEKLEETYELTRVGIDDESSTASEHALFSVRAVMPNTVFTGEILFYNLQDRELELLLLAIAELRLDRIGRMSTIDARIEKLVGFDPPKRLVDLIKELGEWLWT